MQSESNVSSSRFGPIPVTCRFASMIKPNIDVVMLVRVPLYLLELNLPSVTKPGEKNTQNMTPTPPHIS